MSGRLEGDEAERLVDQFLRKWKGVSGPKIEMQVVGVTQSDVSRWRKGKWRYLSEEKAEALRSDVEHGRDVEREERLIAAKWMRILADQLESGPPTPRGEADDADLGTPPGPDRGSKRTRGKKGGQSTG